MKQKILREEFFKIKEELIKLCKQLEDVSNEDPPEFDRDAEDYEEVKNAYYEELERKEKEWIISYKENLEKLTSFDLSEISSNDWNEMIIYAFKDEMEGTSIKADFSETFANLDFSKVKFIGNNFDFHSCKILNFNSQQKEMEVSIDAFDSEIIENNNEYFISEDLPEDVKERFYSKKVSFKDIITYEEVFLKGKERIGYPYNREFNEELMKSNVSFEEIKKVDIELIEIIGSDITPSELLETIEGKEFSAETFNKGLTNIIRKYIIENRYRFLNNGLYPENFRKNNPDLIYYEETPALFDNPQTFKNINLDLLYQYEEELKDKKFMLGYEIKDFIDKVGEEFLSILPQEFEKEQAQRLIKFFNTSKYHQDRLKKVETISQRLPEFSLEEKVNLLKKFIECDYGRTENLSAALELSKIIDISDMDFGRLDSKIKKFGLDKFVNAGYTNATRVEEICTTRELKKIKEYIEKIGIDINFFINLENDKNVVEVIKKCGIDFYLEQGWDTIEDIVRHRKHGVSLEKAKELIENGIELDAVFEDINIVNFINTLGIDNLLKFNKESDDFFYYEKNSIGVVVLNNNLATFSKLFMELKSSNEENITNNNISYEEFIEEICKIILNARKNTKYIDKSEYISEDVKAKIPEEFLSLEEINRVWPKEFLSLEELNRVLTISKEERNNE